MLKKGRHEFTSAPKVEWRFRNISLWRKLTGSHKLRRGEMFVTLAGLCYRRGKIIQNSEYDQVVLKEKFCLPNQYLSFEKNLEVHRINSSIIGPTWIQGDFGRRFSEWYGVQKTKHAAFINVDLMHGIDRSLDTIGFVLESVRDNQKQGRSSLIIFNIIDRFLWAEICGVTFGDVQNKIQLMTKGHRGLSLVETPSSYKSSSVTKMIQLPFVYAT